MPGNRSLPYVGKLFPALCREIVPYRMPGNRSLPYVGKSFPTLCREIVPYRMPGNRSLPYAGKSFPTVSRETVPPLYCAGIRHAAEFPDLVAKDSQESRQGN